MTEARKRHTNNIVIGAGEVFLALLTDAEAPTGERYVGDSAGVTMTTNSEENTVVSGDGSNPTDLTSVVSNITRSFSLTLQDISVENLALFVLGDAGAQSDVAGDAVARLDGAMTVKQGHWYQLGRTAGKPAGVASVTEAGFSIHSTSAGAGGTLYTKTTYHPNGEIDQVGDYTLDHKGGRFFVEPGKRIADDATVYVAFTPVVQSRKNVTVTGKKQIKAAFRYIERASAGEGRNIYVPVAAIRPSGDMSLKDRDNAESISLEVQVLQPADGAVSPLYINAAPA